MLNEDICFFISVTKNTCIFYSIFRMYVKVIMYQLLYQNVIFPQRHRCSLNESWCHMSYLPTFNQFWLKPLQKGRSLGFFFSWKTGFEKQIQVLWLIQILTCFKLNLVVFFVKKIIELTTVLLKLDYCANFRNKTKFADVWDGSFNWYSYIYTHIFNS